MALVTDLISYGAGRFAHNNRYHFVRGDGGVAAYTDKGSPPIWPLYGMAPVQNNDVLFTVLDHPLDYKSYLK